MEVAGLVLGAVPIVINALESYRKAAEILKDTHKWLETIEEIQDVVEIQTEMLRVTLLSLGVEWLPQTGIPIELIEVALKERKPLQWQRFIRIIQKMDDMMTDMARDLCPDAKGPPKWRDVESSRMQWEWGRVRRSFRGGRREKISSKLTFWNDAPRNCGLERSDALTEQGRRGVDEVRQSFDNTGITAVRRDAAFLHKALNENWGCSCAEPHSANILLDWHNGKRPQSKSFSLAIQSSNNSYSQLRSMEAEWKYVTVHIQKTHPAAERNATPDLLPAAQGESQLLDPKKKRIRFFDLIRPKSPGRSLVVPASRPPAAQNGLHPSGAVTHTITSEPMETLIHLCPLVTNQGPWLIPQGTMAVPDSDSWEVHFISHNRQSDGFSGAEGTIPLRALLSGTVHQRTKARSRMTRKERFGIAAALTWGTLYLCDSAWLDESIEGNTIGVTFKESDRRCGSRTFGSPILTDMFPRSQAKSDSDMDTGHAAQHEGNKLVANQVQKQALYTLAIRLMELGLDKDFGQLRREYEDESFEPNVVSVSDFEIAQTFIDSLNHDCGIGYRNAVEHCLRFLFAGSPENCFLDARFREAFFDMVIAPVQNVYNTIDEYQYQP